MDDVSKAALIVFILFGALFLVAGLIVSLIYVLTNDMTAPLLAASMVLVAMLIFAVVAHQEVD